MEAGAKVYLNNRIMEACRLARRANPEADKNTVYRAMRKPARIIWKMAWAGGYHQVVDGELTICDFDGKAIPMETMVRVTNTYLGYAGLNPIEA